MEEKKFINREEELNTLKELLKREDSCFIIVYGRRRIGKTALLNKLQKDGFVDMIITLEDTDYITNLNKVAEEIAKKYSYPSYSPKTFKDVFRDLPNNISLALDEFSYLKNFGEFQEIVDKIIRKKNIKLILCGSLIRVMEDLSYRYSSPLFGRADAIIKVMPLRLRDVFKWYGINIDIETVLKIYMSIGGIPRYMELISNMEDLLNHFFYKNGLLLREGKLLLKEMFPSSLLFSKILHAIAEGETKSVNIANKVGIKSSEISKYLSILEDHGLIKKEYPFNKVSKKHVRFYVQDVFFGFWHMFVWKWYGDIESGYNQPALLYYRNNENKYYGIMFENVAKEVLSMLLPSYVVGKWWHKDKEIDIIAINEQTKEMLALEVKWQDIKLRDAKKIIEELHEKLPYVEWHNEERKEVLGIFAKKIDKKAKEWLESNDYKGWDLRDVEKVI